MSGGEKPVGPPAVVHDFFVQEGGGERVALELARMIPKADVYTSFFDAHLFAGQIDPGRVHAWPLQRVLGPTPHFRALLPLYALYFGALRLENAPLVLSSSVAFTKAVRTAPAATHVTYVHTPMRYAWDLDAYLTGSSTSLPSRLAARTIRPMLQAWDRRTASRPDYVVCNSETVRERIRTLWRRDAEVIHPPVDTAEIALADRDEGFLLVAARLLAYRRIDLAVMACTRLGRELVVAGDGPERRRLEAIAGPSVRFMGRLSRPELVGLFRSCHAYLVPGVEDFGIAPVEAMAAGKPVVALSAGGARETVIEGKTGILFEQPDVPSLAAAIERLDTQRFDPVAIREHAETFDTSVFRERWRQLLARLGVDPTLYSAAMIGAASERGR